MIPNNVPMIGDQQARAKQSILENVNAMAQGIYVKTVSKRLDRDGEWDAAELEEMAVSARIAAKAYFTSIGIQFSET
jgi:hypothetical protein